MYILALSSSHIILLFPLPPLSPPLSPLFLLLVGHHSPMTSEPPYSIQPYTLVTVSKQVFIVTAFHHHLEEKWATWTSTLNKAHTMGFLLPISLQSMSHPDSEPPGSTEPFSLLHCIPGLVKSLSLGWNIFLLVHLHSQAPWSPQARTLNSFSAASNPPPTSH